MDPSNPTISEINAYFEAEYVEFKKNNPRQHYLYWIGKDRMRYISEVLNEVDKENKKPSGYPEISVKIFQILSIIVFFQISGPSPEKWLCVLVSLTSLSFPFCFVLNEIHQNKNGNRPVTQIEELYQRLDGFISNIKEGTRNEKSEKQQLKIRILALENNLFKWMPNPSKRKLAQRENLERARSAIPGSVDNVLKQNEEVQKLLSEEKKRVVDLEKRIDVYKTELHRYETCLKNAEEKLSMEIRDHNCTKLALKTCQEKKVASEISYEAQISELQNRCNQLLLESPARGKVLKKYEDISSPHTKNRRCERIVEEMGKFVGEDSLDAFGKDFALFLSKSSRFSFRLSMTAEETFELVTRLN